MDKQPERREPYFHPSILEFEKMASDQDKYLEFLKEWLSHSWKWAREDKYKLVFKVQAEVIDSLREFLNSRGLY